MSDRVREALIQFLVASGHVPRICRFCAFHKLKRIRIIFRKRWRWCCEMHVDAVVGPEDSCVDWKESFGVSNARQ